MLASSITAIIAVVWVSTIPARFAHIKATAVIKQNDGSDIGSLLNTSKDQLGNVIESIKDVPDTLNEDGIENIPEQHDANASLDTLDIHAVRQATNDDTTISSTSTTTTSEKSVATTTQYVPPIPRVVLIGTSTSQISP